MDELELKKKAADIRLLVLDCDGVLTDGRLYFGPDGEELKIFHVLDGQGIVDWHKAGGVSAIITGRSSQMLKARASELNIKYIIQNAEDKASELRVVCKSENIPLNRTAFVGDDVGDIPALELVGFPISVSNGVPSVRAIADLVTSKHGGMGAVREVTDLLLSSRL